jgi:branched-chain amino acid transport system ATP-binding protein
MALLEVKNLSKYFGGLAAISNLDLQINEGEIIGLIGPNGAGKTTFFNLITKFIKPSRGEIIFLGENITGLRPDQIASRGIVRTFQLSSLFMNFTVLENVLVANQLYLCRNLNRHAIVNDLFLKGQGKGILLERSLKLLESTGLGELKEITANNLPYGYQRFLGLAMALASDPKVLLIDELLTGMNSEESKFMIKKIKEIKEKGISIINIEHNIKAIVTIADRIVVLDSGEKIAEGRPEEIIKNRKVIDIYLGTEELL